MTRTSHLPRLYYSNYTWQRVQIMKLLVMQFSPFSHHLISLGPNILLSIPFSNALSLCFSLNARDQVSHPYRTAGKIVVLYILIFKFFDGRREDRSKELKRKQSCKVLVPRGQNTLTEDLQNISKERCWQQWKLSQLIRMSVSFLLLSLLLEQR
jgi:hypothetical protein